MPDLFPLIAPLVRRLEPETAHQATVRALKWGLGSWLGSASADPPELATSFLGLDLANPIGLAAGFDKNAEVPDAMLRMGFGMVEVGTITPLPQQGNPRPRVFRLMEDGGVINRLGFNNDGAEAAAAYLRNRKRRGIVGVNLGANKDSDDRIDDYARGLASFDGLADYFVINISSPNTPGLRELQNKDSFGELLDRVGNAKAKLKFNETPLLVKIAPDMDDEALRGICEQAMALRVDGLIVSNTTLARPGSLHGKHCLEDGGLSGRPLMELSTRVLAKARQITGGRLPLVGVGGVSSGRDAYDKICAGASVVQLYSALVFKGPGLVQEIKTDLARLLVENGFGNVGAAAGTRAEHFASETP